MPRRIAGPALSALLSLPACSEPAGEPGPSSEGAGPSVTETGTGAPGDAGSGGAGQTGSGTGTGGADAAAPAGPARYPADRWASPITEHVADRLRAVAAAAPERRGDVFMKAGASETVNPHLFWCFAGGEAWKLDLAAHGALLPTLEHFRKGDAAGSTPFDRATLAAQVGKSAGWVIGGDPSPLDQEISAIDPRFAFVNYGTNDMQLGATHLTALWPFYDNLSELLDRLEAGGIVPIVTGLNPRGDTEAAERWVPTWDALTRGMAEARQVPYFSLYLLMKDLPDKGLAGDGVHGNTYYEAGAPQPCVLTEAALQYNHNRRNLSSVTVLDAVKRVVLDQEAAPDAPGPPVAGEGTPSSPYVVDALPFTHAGTTLGGQQAIGSYPGCGAEQDESGPEVWYRLWLDAPTPVRLLVFDRAGVDVDVHLLSEPDGAACIERDDRAIQRTLGPGTYFLALDTFVQDGAPQAGDYLLVVVRCEPGDPDCG